MERPLQNSYWVLPGSLLAGEHPFEGDETQTRMRIQRLIEAGIDSFVDLTFAGELPDYQTLLPPSVQWLRSPIRDTDVPEDIGEMRSIQAHIAESLAAGRHLYVHCRA